MRYRYFLAPLVLLAITFAVLAGPVSAKDGLDLLPGDTQGVLTIEDLSRLYTTLGIMELRSEYPETFRFLSTELIEDVGIDLLDPDALAAEGFDLSRPLHIGIITEPSAVVLLIPGEGRALKWVRAKMEGQGVVFSRQEKHKGVTLEADDADEVACFVHKSYIGIVITNHEEGGGPALETAKGLLDRSGNGTIATSDRYRQAMSKLPDGADLYLYVGPELQSHMSTWGRSGEELAEHGMSSDDMKSWYRTMGLEDMVSGGSMHLEPDRLTMNSYSWVGKGSPIRDWLHTGVESVSFLQRVPSQPWLVSLHRVNMAALWKAMRPMFDTMPRKEGEPSVAESLAEVREEVGIDIEADVINQIRGNLGLLINRAALMGTDLVVLVQVAEPARFATVVSKLTELGREEMAKKASENPDKPPTQIVEETLDGVKMYRIGIPPMVEVCYGIIDDHFVVTASQLRFRSIVDGGAGFPDEMKNADIKAGLLDSKGSVFYIDFRALSRDAEGVLPMLGPKGVTISQVLSELSELVSVVKTDDEGMSQVVTLTATRTGIWKQLVAVLLDQMDKVELD